MSASRPEATDASTAAVERLLLVTLALEEALQDEEFPESSALFEERATILDELSRLAVSAVARSSIERIQAVEKRIVGFLTDWRTAAMKEFNVGRSGRNATTAYLASACGSGFSMDGKH